MDTRAASFAAAVSGVVLLALIATGQEPRQEWDLRRSDAPDMVHFRVERWRSSSHSSHSNDVPLSRFRGLPNDIFDRGGHAQFAYVTDPGTLRCEGDFSSRRGSGTYKFEPDPQFAAELKNLGYTAPNEDQIFTMLMTDVSLRFARGVRDAGLHATTGQLIDLRIHGVNLDYIRETADAGYKNLSAQDYIDMRIHGVNPDFLRDLKTYGYNLSPKEIIELRIHGVSIDFVRDLKAAGYDLTNSQIVELRIHGVDSSYMRELKSYGLQPHASDMVQLRIHGVTPDYLRGLTDAGYSRLVASEITDLRIHGVDTGFIQDAKSLGYNFTPRELIDLRIHGVDGSYLRRLRDSGMRNLSAAQITKLRIHGVD
jgi:hypothetical protein